ncbi:MAG: hypothetical protein ACRESZ_14020, partial [Methylococcales bacterium]
MRKPVNRATQSDIVTPFLRRTPVVKGAACHRLRLARDNRRAAQHPEPLSEWVASAELEPPSIRARPTASPQIPLALAMSPTGFLHGIYAG